MEEGGRVVVVVGGVSVMTVEMIGEGVEVRDEDPLLLGEFPSYDDD